MRDFLTHHDADAETSTAATPAERRAAVRAAGSAAPRHRRGRARHGRDRGGAASRAAGTRSSPRPAARWCARSSAPARVMSTLPLASQESAWSCAPMSRGSPRLIARPRHRHRPCAQPRAGLERALGRARARARISSPPSTTPMARRRWLKRRYNAVMARGRARHRHLAISSRDHVASRPMACRPSASRVIQRGVDLVRFDPDQIQRRAHDPPGDANGACPTACRW